MWNLKHDTNESVYKIETDSQTENRLVVAKEEGVGIRRCKLLYIEWIQGPTVEHRELYSISWDKPSWKRI